MTAADGWPALFYVNVPWVCWRWGWPIAICRPTGGAAPWRGALDPWERALLA
jgi:hypothetical protein